ncbi:MAG: pyruvate ferredoxin oxidoreductase [Candidatus Njordarchaeales archaeon]
MSPAEQIDMLLNGDEAAAWAARHCNVDVVAAYPITPQTIIVERFSEFVANGEVDCEFISVESEHSALSACVGAAAAGARAFTATAANGLNLMHEILYIASSLRLPIVMAVANRAVSGPINIHCDHTDAIGSAFLASWLMFFCENAQEVYDTIIQAYKIAENPRVLLPVMVSFDGFLISHTAERIKIFKDEKVVQEFLGGPRKVAKINLMGKEVELSLNPKNPVPVTFGPLDLFDYYFEHKRQQFEAMENAYKVIEEVHEQYAEISGRRYGDGFVVPYRTEDAEIIAVVMGSTAGTMRYVVDEMREEGIKIGVLRVRTYRPFPYDRLAKYLSRAKVVGVFDRVQDAGLVGGPLFIETRASLYDLPERPIVVNYVYGLGGRDTTPEMIRSAFDELVDIAKGKIKPFRRKYLGVRE